MTTAITITVTAPMTDDVVTRHRTVTGAARRLVKLDREADAVHAAWGRGVYAVAVDVNGRRVPDEDLIACDGDYAAALSA